MRVIFAVFLAGLGAIAAAGAVLSLVVNIATYTGNSLAGIPLKMQYWFCLHLTAMMFCLAGMLGAHLFGLLKPNRIVPMTILRRPIQVIVAGLFIFAFVNFIAFIGLVGGGGPGEYQGRPALVSHGRLIRYVTPEE